MIAREDIPGDQRLVAYVVAQHAPTSLEARLEPEAQRDAERKLEAELKNFAQNKLPEYMVPSHVVLLEHWPLSPNGKVDRKALPAPPRKTDDWAVADGPVTPTEQAVMAIWCELLGMDRVGIHADFFALGGHSLLAMRLMIQLQQRFERPLPLSSFIFNPTIAHLAAQLDALQAPAPSASAPTADTQSEPTGRGNAPGDETSDEEEALRKFYDLLGQQEALNRARRQWLQRPPARSRVERLIQRLPAPTACLLLRRLVRAPRAQQRYWAEEVALIRAFHGAIDPSVTVELLVENSLFYNLLALYGFNQRQAGRSMLGRAPETVSQVTGWEWLEQARQEGNGAIIAANHNIALWWLTEAIYNKLAQATIMGMERMIRQKRLDEEIATPVLYARQLEVALEVLQRGESVLIMPDAQAGTSNSREVHFLGRRRIVRLGFAELALQTGAPVLPLLSEMEPGKPINLRLLAPLDAGDATMPYAARVEHLSNQYLAHLERAWRAVPWALPWDQMKAHLAFPSVAKR